LEGVFALVVAAYRFTSIFMLRRERPLWRSNGLQNGPARRNGTEAVPYSKIKSPAIPCASMPWRNPPSATPVQTFWTWHGIL